MPVDPKDTLRAYARVQTAADRRLFALLRQARRDLNRTIARTVGDSATALVTRDQARLSRAAVNERMATLYRELGKELEASKLDAALAADRQALEYDAVLMRAVRDDPKIKAYLASARQTSVSAVELAERRLQGRSYVPLAQQVYRTGAVSSGLVDSAVNSALARGLSARDFAKEVVGLVNPNTPGGASYAAMRLARTETNNAFHARSIDDARSRPWVAGMRWNLSGSHPRPDACNDYAERDDGHGVGVFAVDDVPEKPHPNCVLGDTQIAAEGVIAVTRSRHVGHVYVLHFRSGQTLHATPNHPILGIAGWIRAADVKPGDQVIKGLLDPVDGPGRGNDVVDRPPTIEQIYNAGQRLSSSRDRVPVASSQFHSDGQFRQGSVDVVRTDRHLRDHGNAESPQRVDEFGFARADLESHLRAGSRALRKRSGAIALPSASSMGWCDHCGTAVSAHRVESSLSSPERQPCARHRVADLANGDSARGGRFRQALAALVGSDEVTVVERIDFDGHVYNLQTESGWYLSNGTASKNCLCYVTEVNTNEYNRPGTGRGKPADGGSTAQDDEDAWLDAFLAGDYDDYIDTRIAAAEAADRARKRG